MVSIRKLNGFLWGVENLDFKDLGYYEAAMDASDIRREEKLYQQVFHSAAHSTNLTYEIFQKKSRNNVTSLVDPTSIVVTFNSDINNNVKSFEAKNNIKYSKVADEVRVNDHRKHLQDTTLSLLYLVKDLIKILNDKEIKVLAYLIAKERLDDYLIEFSSFETDCSQLYEYLEIIWRDNIIDINRLNKFVGTKYATESARYTLLQKVKEKYPNFLKR